jgi:hypothetical protein
VFRSLDGGQSWQPAGAGIAVLPGAALRVTALAVDKDNPNHVVAATALGLGGRLVGDAVYESQNAGEAWTKSAEVQGLISQVTIDQGVIYAASASGLRRYGEQASRPGPVIGVPLRWTALSNPTGIQVLILVLTVAVAAVALAWRKEWLMRRREVAC